MTFDDILAQVLDLLQREKRVSYRALKRRFELDDDYLEDVKDELIYAKKLAVDEENRVLVWAGEHASAMPSPASGTSVHTTSSLAKYSPQELRGEFRWLRRAEFREQFCFRVRPLHRLRVTIELLKIGLELLL